MFRQFVWTIVIALFFSSPLFSADWTQFRGADGNGNSPDTGLQKKWAPEGPKLLWTADFIGSGWSGVSISGNNIYITGNVKSNGNNVEMVFCLDKNGKKIWEKDNGPAHAVANQYPGTRGTPTLEGNFVYNISASGEVACFDTTKMGEKVWSRNIMEDYEAPFPMWKLGHALVIDGDCLISPLGGPKHSAIAMDKKTGKTVWTAPPAPGGAETAYTTPYIFEFEGIRVVTVMSDSTVEGIDTKTGKRLFTIPWTNSRTCHCTQPLYRDGNLFCSTGYDGGGAKLFKLSKNTDGTISLAEVWAEPRFNNHHHGLVRVGDYVFGTAFDGSWCSINFKTGKMGYAVRSVGKGSVVYADGLIYGLAEDNKTVILLNPDPMKYDEISRFELPQDVPGSKSWAHPVVLDGRLYLRHGQYLYCYDVKE